MNLQKMIAELQAERTRLDDAILALERLSATAKRRGRPRSWPQPDEQPILPDDTVAPSAPDGNDGESPAV